MSNTNREAFEAWVTKFRSNVILRRFENGEYVSAVTENYFNVWQAALAQANVNEQSQAQQTESKWISVGEVNNKYGDPETFAERSYYIDEQILQTVPIGAKLVALPPAPIECNEKPEGDKP